jgi:hypothetical protein
MSSRKPEISPWQNATSAKEAISCRLSHHGPENPIPAVAIKDIDKSRSALHNLRGPIGAKEFYGFSHFSPDEVTARTTII